MDLQQKLEAAVAIEDYEVAAILRDQIHEEALEGLLSGPPQMSLSDLRSRYADEVRSEVQKRMRKIRHTECSLIQIVDTRINTVTFSCDGKELLTLTYTPFGPKFD
jgi:hypothetical protein